MKPATGSSFGFVELNAGDTRVRIVPELGGKIVSLQALGREWLWTSEDVRRLAEGAGPSDIDPAQAGGYDDCFPTKAACRLSSQVPEFSGLSLAEGGELRSARPSITVEANDEGQRAVCTWEGRQLPYRFSRAVQVRAGGTVVMGYAVENVGTARLPFIWVAHSVMPLTAATRVDLPAGARVRVGAAYGSALRGVASEFRWPMALTEKGTFDFSRPDLVARRYACQLFVDLPERTKLLAVEDADARLELSFDDGVVSNVGLWLNKREWAPDRHVKPELNLAIEPGMGSVDSLADALGASQNAQWLAPGETRAWALTWRAVRAGKSAGATWVTTPRQRRAGRGDFRSRQRA